MINKDKLFRTALKYNKENTNENISKEQLDAINIDFGSIDKKLELHANHGYYYYNHYLRGYFQYKHMYLIYYEFVYYYKVCRKFTKIELIRTKCPDTGRYDCIPAIRIEWNAA